MLGLAILVAIGGFLTIGFAYWAMSKAVPGATKDAAGVALQHIEQASQTADVTNKQFQAALQTAVANPESQAATQALQAASGAHEQASKNVVDASGALKELLGGLGTVFQDLGALSPPIAALCVAVLMFLTAGGIEVANRLIH